MRLSIRWRLGAWPREDSPRGSRRDALQRQPGEMSADAARLPPTIQAGRAEWIARLVALTVHQRQEIARESVRYDEVALKLRAIENELRWKSQLAELAVGVVQELDAFVGEVAAQAARAAEESRGAASLGIQLDRARRTAGQARDLARRFLTFRRGQAQSPAPTDLNGFIRDLAPTLQQLAGNGNELHLRLEATTAPVSLSHKQLRRLLFSLAMLCGDALPLGGQVIFETTNVETIPAWDPNAPRAEPFPFVHLTVTVSGHAPQPMRVTPSLESLVQECDGYCREVSTDNLAIGLGLYLSRRAGHQQPLALTSSHRSSTTSDRRQNSPS